MKRLISAMMAAFMLVSGFVVPGYAVEIDSGEGVIMPRYSYTRSVAVMLDISEDGTATAATKVMGYPDTATSVLIFMYLERKENGQWKVVESWSESASSYSLTMEESAEAESGYMYRVRSSCYVYAGTASEYITKNSQEVQY